MFESVRLQWIPFTASFEGGISSLYNDIRGMTTIAYGNLCDSPGQASTLQLVHSDGRPATVSEKVAAWEKVHNDPQCASQGWRYAARLTDLRLTPVGMADLAYRRLAANESAMRIRLPEWETYPACAQMAMHSLAWACGPAAHFPKLFAACMARDWGVAAIEIHMNERTPEGKLNAGLVPRNVANRVLMLNAARVDAYHLDPEIIDWVHVLGVAAAETVPDLSVHDEPTNPGTYPSLYVASEEATGSGGTIHPLLTFEPHEPEDPDAA